MAKRKPSDPAAAEQTRVTLLSDLRDRLAPLRPKAAAKLGKVTAKRPPKGAERLRFEMHEVCETFSIVLFAEGDNPGGQYVASVFSEAAIPGGSDVDWDGFWAVGVDPWATVKHALVELVADAWADAGGAKYPLPAVICQHDDAREFDLTRRCWVTDHLGQTLPE